MLVALEDAAVETPDGTLLFRTGKQSICQGDRIVLLGRTAPARRGWSTCCGSDRTAGRGAAGIKATPSLVLGYGDQALADLDDDDTPLRVIIRRFDLGDQRARTLLAGAGITIEMQASRSAACPAARRHGSACWCCG